MDTGLITFLIIGAVIAAYFVFFHESKQAYPEGKIKEIFATVSSILEPHSNDHELVITRKEKLASEIIIVKRMYSRSPSIYTKDEILAIEKMVSEANQEMQNVCVHLRDFKPSLVALIDATEETLKKTTEIFESLKNNEPDEDTEDVLDMAEKHIESCKAKLPRLKSELEKLENSIARYQNI